MKYTLPSGEHRDIDNKFNIGDNVLVENWFVGKVIKIFITFTGIRYLIQDSDYPNEFNEIEEYKLTKG